MSDVRRRRLVAIRVIFLVGLLALGLFASTKAGWWSHGELKGSAACGWCPRVHSSQSSALTEQAPSAQIATVALAWRPGARLP